MKKFWEILLILFVLVYISLATYIAYQDAQLSKKSDYKTLQPPDNSAKQTKNSKQVTIVTQDKDSNINQMAEVIRNYSQKINGQIGIYYKNITTNESVILNTDQEYYMASLYKIILTLYVLDKVRNGQLTLEEKVGTTSATLELALEEIITESNNEYAQQLADQYGWINIERKMKKKLGIEFSFGTDLAISTKNVGILLEDIALAQKISKSDSEYLLNLMAKQKLTSKLPKYLPSDILSHNKTGEWEDYSHDAGIFYTPKANYILIFMSKTEDPLKTNEQMALMSKEIYESLNNK